MEVKTKVNRPLQEIYLEIADGYEAANRVLTLGLDRGWRRRAARRAAAGGGILWLDVCSGTGELAQNLSRLAPTGTRLVALDFSRPMLSHARTKSMAAPTFFTLGEAALLPFPDGQFDLITISFATRNLNFSPEILTATFREFLRVLKPGGRLMNLETSQPRNSIIRGLFHLYADFVVRRVGRRLSGSRSGYAYLAASMRNFYTAGELAAILRTAGFSPVSVKRLLFGVAAVHLALKAAAAASPYPGRIDSAPLLDPGPRVPSHISIPCGISSQKRDTSRGGIKLPPRRFADPLRGAAPPTSNSPAVVRLHRVSFSQGICETHN